MRNGAARDIPPLPPLLSPPSRSSAIARGGGLAAKQHLMLRILRHSLDVREYTRRPMKRRFRAKLRLRESHVGFGSVSSSFSSLNFSMAVGHVYRSDWPYLASIVSADWVFVCVCAEYWVQIRGLLAIGDGGGGGHSEIG